MDVYSIKTHACVLFVSFSTPQNERACDERVTTTCESVNWRECVPPLATRIVHSHIECCAAKAWVLIPSGASRVEDLARHVRETFAISDNVELFLDDFLLPPKESIDILTVDDVVVVKTM